MWTEIFSRQQEMRVWESPLWVTHEAQIVDVITIYNEEMAREQSLIKSSQFHEWRREKGKESGQCSIVEIKIRKEFQENIGISNSDVLQRSQVE